MIVFVGAVAAGATGAFFSDTETSSGNTFAAGDIDLQIDNESYVTNVAGVLVASEANTWAMSNLTDQLFFSFEDVKPGDIGEDTISIHVGSNDAWACMAADITATPENTLVDPETDAGDVGPANGDNGELQNYLNFTFWKDDGDNVFEVGETVITQLTGPAGTIFNGNWLPIADSLNGPALTGNVTSYIGKAWCFGTLTPSAVTQDGLGKVGTPSNPNNVANGPLVRGTGITCDGSGSNNDAQTDGVVVDVSFQAVQARNNAQFACSSLPAFVGGTPTQGPTVGSNFTAYTVGDTCDVTVDDTGGNQALDTIAEGIATASGGQTVCVADGTYTGPIEVNKNITLASINGPSVTTINGGVKITSSDATVKGFTVNTGIVSGEPNPVGFYVASGSNILIDSNDIDGNSVALSSGVLFVTGAAYTNVDVTNNDIHHNNAGIYTNPHTGIIDINTNDIFDNNAGIGGLMGASVTNNEFTHTVAAQEAIGTDSTFDSNVATAHFNNFLNGIKLNDYGAVAIVNAEDNFWNTGGVSQTTAGQVDFTPETLVQYMHN